jgi:pyruvate kinase
MSAMRRAKILCTLGPRSSAPEGVAALIAAGMNGARLNFSHGSHENHAQTYATIREQAQKAGTAIAILADLQGPKIRVGAIPGEGFSLEAGQVFRLTVDAEAELTPERVTVDYLPLAREAKVGDPILMDDGALELKITAVEGDDIVCEVVIGGVLKARKGVNLPSTELSLPSLTEKDEADLRYALELGVDLVALSFVRTVADVNAAKAIMKEAGREVPLIAKIEKPEAVKNLSEIIDACSGLMVARGDLGVEMGPEQVPLVQKRSIEMCNERGKLVITATQMLDSMIRNPRPTRAEASDVANAVFDGSDVLMLSGETATGDYPNEAVETMDRIIRAAERAPRHWDTPPEDMDLGHKANAIARACVASTRSLKDTRAIIVYTGSGGTARLISDYRPSVPIYAFTNEQRTFHQLALYWGVVPIYFEHQGGDEQIFAELDRAVLDLGIATEQERVAITMGWPLSARTSANMLKLHRVGDSLRS